MYGKKYEIKRGDTLWGIAKTHFGSGAQWPRIWRYNNRRDVIQVTGHGIPNPDLIYAGRTILIPVAPAEARRDDVRRAPPAPAPARAAPNAPSAPSAPNAVGLAPSPAPASPMTPPAAAPGLRDALPDIHSPISFKYQIPDTPQRLDTPTATIEFQIKGEIILMSRLRYPATYVTSGGQIEAQVTQQANHAFGQLINDNRFIFDPKTKEVAVRSMLVSRSYSPNAPATAIGVEVRSGNMLPSLRAEIRFPRLEGQIDGFVYVAVDVKYVVYITPRPQLPPPALSPDNVTVQRPVEAPEEPTNWGRVFAVGLVVVGSAVVVGTIVEDVFTGGVGTADDPASFAAAAAAFARAASLWRGAQAALPRAMTPAAVQMTNSMMLAPAH
jgi:hypothetical protein